MEASSPTRLFQYRTLLLCLAYAAFFHCVNFFLYRTGIVTHYPSTENLMRWDASWYNAVAHSGYEFHSFASTSGFFYLFPAIWKLTHLGAFGMAMLNIVFFSTGFTILAGMYRISLTDKLVWLSFPTVYFCFVPYTEALFFLLCSLLVYGISARRVAIIMVSLFLLSLTRVVVILIVPGLLALSLVEQPRQLWLRGIGRFLWLYLLPSVLGFAVFVLIQYAETGVWFAYFTQQAEYWGHKFNPPILPFSSLGGQPSIWLSALGAVVDLAALILLLVIGLQWLIKNKVQSGLLMLSCAYLASILYITFYYNPCYGSENTNVTGIFRYSLMSPFFYIFLHTLTHGRSLRWQHYVGMFLIANVAYLTFGSYLHLQAMLFYNFCTLIVFALMARAKESNQWASYALVAINFFFQVHLYQIFLTGSIYPD